MPMPQKRPTSRKPTSKKAQKHRNRLRAQGVAPIQSWVPDVRTPGFKEEAERQSRLAAKSLHATDDQAFVASISAIKS
jgi:hypothetical protein